MALFTFYTVSSSGKLKGVLLNVIIETDRIVKKVNQTLVWVSSLLSGFVYAHHPAAPGLSPKHTIYAFII